MRLIDADAINFRCTYDGDCTADKERCLKCLDYECDVIDIQNQPTVFDVDEVIEKMESLKDEKTLGSHKVMIKEAIDIVRNSVKN